MAVTQYIGARYVPLIEEEWSISKEYEPLTVVLYQGSSYTSRQAVPKGINILDTKFWVCTGNYNAQVEMYRRETARVRTELEAEVQRATEAEQAEVQRATEAEEAIENALNYVKADYVKAFDTVKEMKADESLVSGMVVRTFNFNENDQMGAFYNIKENGLVNNITTIQLANGLYAEYIQNNNLDLKSVNDESCMINVSKTAMSYVNNSEQFIYGGQYTALRDVVQKVGGKWQINCSTFAMLVAYGVTFENSAYNKGAGNNIISGELATDYKAWNWFKSINEGQSGDYRFKYTYDLAAYLYSRGYCFEPNEDLSNIKPGDMLLMKNQTGSEGSSSTFMDIDHSCIFGYWNNDGLYTVFEVGSVPSNAQYPVSNLKNNCVLVARFPFTPVQHKLEDISYKQGVVSKSDNILCYIKHDEFVPGEYYTLIAKITNNASVSDVYPAVYQQNTRLAGYNDAISKPENDIYVIPFVPGNNDTINLRMNTSSSSIVRPTTTCEWYQIVKGIFNITDELTHKVTPFITLNEGYTNIVNTLSNNVLYYAVNGTFNAGTNSIGTADPLFNHGDITPVQAICYPSSGVASDVEVYFYNKTLTVRNNSGSAITGRLFMTIPVANK